MMSLDWKIGQLFVVPARGDVARHIRDNHVGGVIWFESTTRVTAETNARLQSIARTPLLISADLEAGMGMRFTDATWWPPAMAIAATGDPALAEEMGRVTAAEALEIGVNHILAPVADVNVDPQNPVINTRSFGEDAHEVARYVAAFVRGVQGEGCLATAKHFPGHGDTHVDSHRALPVLDVSRERLERVELVPFRAAIEAGVASVMLGHLGVPALDDTPAPVRAAFENIYGTRRDEVTLAGVLPATVSPKIIRLLRDLGFDGLAITDSFDMGGLAAHFDPGEAAVRAIEAGEDQILFSADTDAAIAAVKSAVRTGRITETRIDESVERILRAKSHVIASASEGPGARVARDERASQRRILRAKSHVIPSVSEGPGARVGRDGRASQPRPPRSLAHARDDKAAVIAERGITFVRDERASQHRPPRSLAHARHDRAAWVAERAITLVRDEHGHLPLRGNDFTAVVVSDLPEPNPIEIAVRELNAARVLTIDANSSDVDVDGAIVMLLALRPKSGAGRIAMPPAAQRLAERRARDVIAISFGSPYVLRAFRTAVCAYGIQPVLQRAAIRAIRGEAPMSGRLPVRGIEN